MDDYWLKSGNKEVETEEATEDSKPESIQEE
jgi:hypothetical protein